MKIGETAQNYEAPKTMNIADLKEVSVDIEIETKIVKPGEEGEFTYDYVEVEGVEYRVPVSVIVQLKDHLEANPELKKFKVSKKGTGMTTKYTVIPL